MKRAKRACGVRKVRMACMKRAERACGVFEACSRGYKK